MKAVLSKILSVIQFWRSMFRQSLTSPRLSAGEVLRDRCTRLKPIIPRMLRPSIYFAIVAATVNGAAALALADRVGQIAPGFSADVALYDIGDFRELPYWYGDNRCVMTLTRGKPCHPSDLGLT